MRSNMISHDRASFVVPWCSRDVARARREINLLRVTRVLGVGLGDERLGYTITKSHQFDVHYARELTYRTRFDHLFADIA